MTEQPTYTSDHGTECKVCALCNYPIPLWGARISRHSGLWICDNAIACTDRLERWQPARPVSMCYGFESMLASAF